MERPIGELLSEWNGYLTNISRNLMELSEQTDFKLLKLKAKDTTNGYTGLTKLKAAQCVDSFEKLWQNYSLLSNAIDKAVELNNKSSFLYNTEDEVRQILESSSILIVSERVSINSRSLIGSEINEKRETPTELLKRMQESFENLCKDISEILQAAHTVQPRFTNMKVDITKLNSKTEHLGITNIPKFDTDNITKLESDPLQGVMELDKLVYNIEKYRASIKSLEKDYNHIIDTLNKISGSLAELKEYASKSKISINESQKLFGFTCAVRPVISEEVLKSLQDWMHILEKKLQEGNISAIKVGIAKLENECSLKLEIEKENYNYNSKNYNQWLDLKGQFKALLAKSEALRSKGLLSANYTDELVMNIHKALIEIPINLEKCKQLIKNLELSLII